MANILGNIYGSSCVSFIYGVFHSAFNSKHSNKRTSSRSDGRILRIRRPSENLPRTPMSPFMNDIFSSRVFAAKFDRSRKLSVEMGNEEKNA